MDSDSGPSDKTPFEDYPNTSEQIKMETTQKNSLSPYIKQLNNNKEQQLVNYNGSPRFSLWFMHRKLLHYQKRIVKKCTTEMKKRIPIKHSTNIYLAILQITNTFYRTHEIQSAVLEPSKYGQLILLGCNGSLQSKSRGRKRSKFVLKKKYFSPDGKDVDMFQIGRSSEAPIDFVVLDNRISRYACRILADRNTNICKIYAGAFDTSGRLVLGEKARKWQKSDEDGLTTNGVLIMHPRGSFGEATWGYWLETSVTGEIHLLRDLRFSEQKGEVVDSQTNSLQDGTLIDLAGATLLFRSAEGLARSPSKQDIIREMDKINREQPQYSEDLKTLVIPFRTTDNVNEPCVYICCGHVQNWPKSRPYKKLRNRKCPVCLKWGPVTKIYMGLESAFYVDCGPPTFAFNPCGHIATEKTVKYWATINIPEGSRGYHAVCPFCATPLIDYPGYIALKFQDNFD